MSTPWLKIVTTTSVGGYVLSDGGSERTTVGMCCACNTAPLIAASPSNIMNKSLISIQRESNNDGFHATVIITVAIRRGC